MKKSFWLSAAFIPLLVLCGCAVFTGGRPTPVVFTAMGCGPYNPAAESALERFIGVDNELATSSFMVHCGDIVTGRNKDWPESQYVRVANILSHENRIPTFVVPGDNEWNDQDDPDRHWGYWMKHFFEFESKWQLPPPWRDRQSGRRILPSS